MASGMFALHADEKYVRCISRYITSELFVDGCLRKTLKNCIRPKI